jgi:hypothetical protein
MVYVNHRRPFLLNASGECTTAGLNAAKVILELTLQLCQTLAPTVIVLVTARDNASVKANTLACEFAEGLHMHDHISLRVSVVVVTDEEQHPSNDEGLTHVGRVATPNRLGVEGVVSQLRPRVFSDPIGPRVGTNTAAEGPSQIPDRLHISGRHGR